MGSHQNSGESYDEKDFESESSSEAQKGCNADTILQAALVYLYENLPQGKGCACLLWIAL